MLIEIGSLSSKGQITIPKSIRKKLNLTNKDQLVVFEELQDGRVLIQNHLDRIENHQSTQMNLLKYLANNFKTIFLVTNSSKITSFYKSIKPNKPFTVISDIKELPNNSTVEALIITIAENKIAYIEKIFIMQNGNLVTLFENN